MSIPSRTIRALLAGAIAFAASPGSSLAWPSASLASPSIPVVSSSGSPASSPSAGASVPPRPRAFRVTVSPTPISQPLASDFLGLALEDDQVPQLATASAGSVNPVFVALLRHLDPAGDMVLRLGGQSADRSWWPVPGMSRPLGITYDLGPRWAADARALAQAIGARLIVGVELEAASRRIAAVEAEELLRHIGRRYIAALEIGNEPELYRAIAWYKLLNGRAVPWYSDAGTPVFNRPASWGPNSLVAQFRSFARALPPVAIAGPSVGSPPWLSAFAPLISPSSPIRIVTWHAYGLNQCVRNPLSPHYPSVANLLSVAASRRLTWGTNPYVALAHAAGESFRIDELGSVSCNGRAGVSDTFASALWVADALFNIAAQNIDGVNLHTYPGLPNNLFDLRRLDGRWRAAVHPLYYGAMMFAQAAPAGSVLLRTSAGRQTQLRAWATLAPDRRIRLLVINDSPTVAASVRASIAGAGAGSASVERLQAPDVHATSGVTIGGRTFGAWSATGELQPPLLSRLSARAGAYGVTLGPASAALLTLAPGRRSAARPRGIASDR